jgi:hypothetical protein
MMMMVEMVRNVRPEFHDSLNLGEGLGIVKRYRPSHGAWPPTLQKKGCTAKAAQPFERIRYRGAVS